MAEKPNPILQKASKEATDWLILLQEEPDDLELRRRFETWLKARPEHRAAWTATRHTAGMIEAAPPSHRARWEPFVARARGGASGSPAARAPEPRADKARQGAVAAVPHRRRAPLFAALAAAACLAIVFLPDLLLRMQADYETATGEIRTLRLDDGSTVVLAPDSAIAVAYDEEARRVELLAGEAFFEVVPSQRQPFLVTAGAVQTTVLGTAFNVLREDEAATIALQHGGVRVEQPSASAPVSESLQPGQFVRVSDGGAVVRGTRRPSQIAAWRNGQLIAEDQAMGRLVDRLRRYYDGAIILADDSLADRPVTGVYNLADPLQALRTIAHAHNAKVREITPWLVVITGS